MDRINSEYGKFVITFENICHNIRATINAMSQDKGVGSNEHIYIEILLQGLTALPLLQKFIAIYITKFTKDDALIAEIHILRKRFTELCEIRNNIAHGTTFLGDPHANLDNFMLQHAKLNNNGYFSNVAIIEIKELSNLNLEVTKLEECFIIVKRIILHRKAKKDEKQLFESLKKLLQTLPIKLNPISSSVQF